MKKKVPKRSDAASTRSRKLVLTAPSHASLLADLRTLITSARQRIATAANSTYTMLCWQVESRLLRENLQAGRARTESRFLRQRRKNCRRSSALGSAIRPSPGWHGLLNGSRMNTCVDAVDTIELEPLRRATADQRPPRARLSHELSKA